MLDRLAGRSIPGHEAPRRTVVDLPEESRAQPGLLGTLDLVPHLSVGSQKRAPAHSDCASVSARAGPSRTCACSRYVVRRAVSVPSKPIFPWVPSQNGLACDLPQRQSWYDSRAGNVTPCRHCCDSPSLSVTMVCLASGTPPLTR